MGITGLLPLLRSITRRVDLRMFSGEVVAVDAYSWLHKVIHILNMSPKQLIPFCSLAMESAQSTFSITYQMSPTLNSAL